MTAVVAIAASARAWPDRLHRFFLDHGGGRVVGRMMSADQTTSGSFDVLLIDDVCSFLTPRLVTMVRSNGAEVIGVYVPEDGTDAKRRLLECGISDVIESEATPQEFVAKVDQAIAHRLPIVPVEESRTRTRAVAVTGPTEGVGITEVALALADSLAHRVPTILADLDPVWPAVAQRLDLPVHPNIRTALDHVLHQPERLETAIHQLGEMGVIGGRADGGRHAPIERHEVVSLLDALAQHCQVVVADLGPFGAIEGGLLREFDTAIVVGSGSPVGVARLLRILESIGATGNSVPVVVVINQTGAGSFRRSESMGEIVSAFPELTVLSLPFDRRVVDAAWDGRVASSRGYRHVIASMADVVVSSLS